MQVQPYLSFDGRCDEALEFYRKAVGAEVTMLMRFKESPEPAMTPPGAEDKVLHCSFRIGTTELMASDGECGGKANFSGISLALSAPSEAEAKRLFDGLAEGGKVGMALTPTFFSPAFGMVVDRFGVTWMVVADQPAA